jgi:hypothetical protein
LLAFSYCDALVSIKSLHRRAKVIAQRVFDMASEHNNDISDPAMVILQQLRDTFMIFIDHKKEAKEKLANVFDLQQFDDTDEQELKAIENLFQEKKRSKKSKEIDDIRNQRLGSTTANRRLQQARNLRRLVSLPVPVMLETITSATHILKALDRIFRVYVRGNALPGQLSGGTTVDLAGQTMTFRRFVLQGPYMSWKGFIAFLLDFHIASIPSDDSRSGKNFARSINVSVRSNVFNGVDALIDMFGAAMVFIEASLSATPALIMSKYISLYAEIASTLEKDPWNTVVEWAEFPTETEWEIPYGLNFMQFIDCLGVSLNY